MRSGSNTFKSGNGRGTLLQSRYESSAITVRRLGGSLALSQVAKL
jgi:hypothetical protein